MNILVFVLILRDQLNLPNDLPEGAIYPRALAPF